ncbi:hypothetical protein FFI97_006670 [Variovorax sp. KBS0712]|uniref:hypothetical protein n=1 Tax=Variovorax sp. KBS0712 TaxID=2578111 RepID=UPI00119690DA|nr:hypothetical protein [Variovorax sp. KBS0712]TSD59987.1 hypothetical protein FFI97_006670 [Variovorax sp. KBS0712]
MAGRQAPGRRGDAGGGARADVQAPVGVDGRVGLPPGLDGERAGAGHLARAHARTEQAQRAERERVGEADVARHGIEHRVDQRLPRGGAHGLGQGLVAQRRAGRRLHQLQAGHGVGKRLRRVAEEAAFDGRRLREEHRALGPGVAVGEALHAVQQRTVQRDAVEPVEQRLLGGVGVEPRDQFGAGRQLGRQGRHGGGLCEREVERSVEVLQAELEVARLGPVARERAGGAAQRVVLCVGVAGGDEMLEGLFDGAEPAAVAREAVQTQQRDDGLVVLARIAGRFGLLGHRRVVQRVGEAAGDRVLHVQHGARELVEQRQVAPVAAELGVAHQRADAGGVGAQRGVVAAGLHEAGDVRAVGQRGRPDQCARQPRERAVDRGLPGFGLRRVPGLQQRARRGRGRRRGGVGIGRARCERAVCLHAGGEMVRAGRDEAAQQGHVDGLQFAMAVGGEDVHATGVHVHRAGLEGPHGGVVVGGGVEEAPALAVDLRGEQGGLASRVEGQAFGGREVQAVLERSPAQRTQAADPVDAQVARHARGLRFERPRALCPRGLEVLAASGHHPRLRRAVAPGEEDDAVFEAFGGRRLVGVRCGAQALPGAAQKIGETHGVVSCPARLAAGAVTNGVQSSVTDTNSA